MVEKRKQNSLDIRLTPCEVCDFPLTHRHHLLAFVEDTAEIVKKVYVAMGEPKSSMFLVQKLRDNLGVDAIMPERGEVASFIC